jgi:hypothetical protein
MSKIGSPYSEGLTRLSANWTVPKAGYVRSHECSAIWTRRIKPFRRWISSITSCTHSITFTFKQALPAIDGRLWHLDRDRCRKTLWILRDRLANFLLGRKGRLDWVPFIENDDGQKRWHAHILVGLPNSVTEVAFTEAVRSESRRLEWLHDRIHIEPICSLDASLAYCLKEGPDAFCPEAMSTCSA